MSGHTNNAALNEAAQREHERLRKDADARMADKLNENLPRALRERIAELERRLANVLQSIQSWQMEVAGRDSDIERLERELTETRAHLEWAREDGKKWEKRFEFMVKWYCAQLSCKFCIVTDVCQRKDGNPKYDEMIAAADKE